MVCANGLPAINSNQPDLCFCNCSNGYSGQNCTDDVDECQKSDICGHEDNKCINTIGSYECDCSYDWTGDNCEKSVYCSTRADGLYPHYDCGKAFNCSQNQHSVVKCTFPGQNINLQTGKCSGQKQCITIGSVQSF